LGKLERALRFNVCPGDNVSIQNADLECSGPSLPSFSIGALGKGSIEGFSRIHGAKEKKKKRADESLGVYVGHQVLTESTTNDVEEC